jgi:hypothetical protein
MVLEIILAAILIAFGVMAIYFSVGEGIADTRLIIILLIGVLCILAGAWIIINTITLAVLIRKLSGLAIAGFGLFMIIGFPDIEEYQPFGMSRVGILIGIFSLIVGAYFLFF